MPADDQTFETVAAPAHRRPLRTAAWLAAAPAALADKATKTFAAKKSFEDAKVDLTTAITDIKVGAIVDTAGGTDSIAPQSIAIGRVTAVIEQTGTASALVEVTPFADLRRLSFLTVLLYKPNEQAVQV